MRSNANVFGLIEMLDAGAQTGDCCRSAALPPAIALDAKLFQRLGLRLLCMAQTLDERLKEAIGIEA
jgi:hypothetical protein